jgi:hypothetical protein
MAQDAEDTINWYLHRAETGVAKVEWSCPPRPSLRHWLTCGLGPIRGMFQQDGRAFVVSGRFLYEVYTSQNKVFRGEVGQDANPASIFANGPLNNLDQGGQLMIISAGDGYVLDLDTNNLDPVTDDAFEPPYAMGLYTGTYGVVLKAASNKVQYSNNLDFTDWNGFDFFNTTLSSDNKVAIAVSHLYIFVLGTKYTEVWQNVGGASNVFQATPGTFIEHGCGAPWSVQVLDNTLFYVGLDEQGLGQVWKLDGFTPVRISTTPVEWSIRGEDGRYATNIKAARAWTFQELGHTFYALYVPGLPWQWVYDVATGQWTKWAHWSSRYENWFPLFAASHMFFGKKHLVGDWQSGAIYELDYTMSEDRLINLSGY